MEDIIHKIAMLEIEVLIYKMMTGCLTKNLATDENDVVDKELYNEIQVNVFNHVVALINQDADKAQDWVNRNVVDFRAKLDTEMKNEQEQGD